MVAGSLRPFSSRSLLFAVRRDNPIAHLRFAWAPVAAARVPAALFRLDLVWAAAVVALRALFQVDQFLMLWGLVGLLVAAAAGRFGPAQDSHGDGPSGPLGPARLTRRSADGRRRHGHRTLATADCPRADPDAPLALRRQWMLFLISTGFLVAGVYRTDRYLPAGDTALEVGGEVQKLSDKLQVLKQEQIVPPERAQVMEKDLDRLIRTPWARIRRRRWRPSIIWSSPSARRPPTRPSQPSSKPRRSAAARNWPSWQLGAEQDVTRGSLARR